MPTVLRKDSLRVVIYVDDHEPAHVHVFGDGETKIVIATATVVRRVRVSIRESRRAVVLVQEYRDFLQRRWDDLYG